MLNENERNDKIFNSVKKIDIVFLTSHLGMGGSERQLYLLLKYVDRSKFNCNVIVFNPSPNLAYDKAIENLGFRVWAIPESKKTIKSRIVFIYRKLKKIKPDVIHSWSFHDNPYSGIVGRMCGVPVRLGSLRGSLFLQDIKKMPLLYKWLAINSVSCVVANSRELTRELTDAGCSSNNIYLLHNCVEKVDSGSIAKECSKDLRMMGVSPETVLVGCVGNIRKVKNQKMFIKAIDRANKNHPRVKGIIVGHPILSEPETEYEIRLLIKKRKLENKIILAGFRKDVPELIRRFDIFCLTSNSEGTPNAILEAMAAGLPVVSTRVGGVPDLIEDGKNGILVKPGNDRRFADAVSTLIEDPMMARKMGDKGKKIAEEKFSCDKMAKKMSKYYIYSLNSRI